jgi:hypothetical protein
MHTHTRCVHSTRALCIVCDALGNRSLFEERKCLLKMEDKMHMHEHDFLVWAKAAVSKYAQIHWLGMFFVGEIMLCVFCFLFTSALLQSFFLCVHLLHACMYTRESGIGCRHDLSVHMNACKITSNMCMQDNFILYNVSMYVCRLCM